MESYFKKTELLPCIVQSDKDGEVLMLGYMNKEALEKTISTGFVTFYSRSRKTLWTKGETSGNRIKLLSIYHDCDQDTFLVKGKEQGPCCHTGARSCFQAGLVFESRHEITKELKVQPEMVLNQLFQRIELRKENPVVGSYTNYLFDKGNDKICKKVGEESAEVIIAAKTEGAGGELLNEVGDLVYHLMVLLSANKLSLNQLLEVLKRRLEVQGNLKGE